MSYYQTPTFQTLLGISTSGNVLSDNINCTNLNVQNLTVSSTGYAGQFLQNKGAGLVQWENQNTLSGTGPINVSYTGTSGTVSLSFTGGRFTTYVSSGNTGYIDCNIQAGTNLSFTGSTLNCISITGPSGPTGSTGYSSSQSLAEMSVTNNSTSQTLTTQNTFYTWTTGWTNTSSVGGISNNPTLGTFTTTQAGYFNILCNFSYYSSSANDTFQFSIFKNGSILSGHSQISVTKASTQLYNLSINGTDLASINDVYTIRVSCITSNSINLTIQYCNFSMFGIGGAQGVTGPSGPTGPTVTAGTGINVSGGVVSVQNNLTIQSLNTTSNLNVNSTQTTIPFYVNGNAQVIGRFGVNAIGPGACVNLTGQTNNGVEAQTLYVSGSPLRNATYSGNYNSITTYFDAVNSATGANYNYYGLNIGANAGASSRILNSFGAYFTNPNMSPSGYNLAVYADDITIGGAVSGKITNGIYCGGSAQVRTQMSLGTTIPQTNTRLYISAGGIASENNCIQSNAYPVRTTGASSYTNISAYANWVSLSGGTMNYYALDTGNTSGPSPYIGVAYGLYARNPGASTTPANNIAIYADDISVGNTTNKIANGIYASSDIRSGGTGYFVNSSISNNMSCSGTGSFVTTYTTSQANVNQLYFTPLLISGLAQSTMNVYSETQLTSLVWSWSASSTGTALASFCRMGSTTGGIVNAMIQSPKTVGTVFGSGYPSFSIPAKWGAYQSQQITIPTVGSAGATGSAQICILDVQAGGASFPTNCILLSSTAGIPFSSGTFYMSPLGNSGKYWNFSYSTSLT